MVIPDSLPKPGFHHVRINLGRADIGVAEHGLYAAQVRTILKQVCRETVTDHVWTQRMEDARLGAVSFQELPETLPCHRTATRCDEQVRADSAVQQLGALGTLILFDGAQSRSTYRNQPLFIAFARDADNPCLRIQIR